MVCHLAQYVTPPPLLVDCLWLFFRLRLLARQRLWASLDTQNPTLDLSHLALGWSQTGFEESREATLEIGAAHPCNDRVSIMLVIVASLGREDASPQPRINLYHNRRPVGMSCTFSLQPACEPPGFRTEGVMSVCASAWKIHYGDNSQLNIGMVS